MFEAAISAAVTEPGAPGALRRIEWSEIVARLSASRDFNALFARPVQIAGSFAAQKDAGFGRPAENERAVNLDALGRGKLPVAISVATVREAAASDQGTR